MEANSKPSQCQVRRDTPAHRRRQLLQRNVSRPRGFTLIELLLVVVVAGTMTAVAAPLVQNGLNTIHLSSAVQSATSAISVTRYQALRYGYPFQLALNATKLNYQVSSEPTSINGNANTFSNVGNPVSLSGSPNITLNANTTLQFNPDGTVQFIGGGNGFSLDAPTFTMACAGRTTTVTVSRVGYVTTQTR
jgi:prepilin-type N-terminal cleavage/methylation domain-containing protein